MIWSEKSNKGVIPIIKQMLKDKRGGALTMGLAIALLICILSYPLYVFGESGARISHIKENAQNALDTYTIETGKEVVRSIKSGHDYSLALKEERFLRQFERNLDTTNLYTGHDTSGQLVYRIKEIKTDFALTQTLKTSASFAIEYNYYFMSEKLFSLDFKLNLQSRYHLKTE